MKKVFSLLLVALGTLNIWGAVSAPGVPEIAGVVIFRDSWSLFDMPYGVYGLPWNGSPEFREIITGSEFNAYNGGVYSNGKLLTIAPGTFSGNTFNVHDTDTWELLNSGTNYEAYKFISMAADPESGDIYCCYYDTDWEEYYFGTFSLNSFRTDEIKQLSLYFFNALTFAPDGTLYAITNSGEFGKVNTLTGTYTAIGDTGLVPQNMTSAIYDPASGKIYYALSTDLKSALYSINPATGTAEFLYDMPDGEEIIGMYFPKASASTGAPAAAENLTVEFTEGSLQGSISFLIPDKTHSGEALTGQIGYSVRIDGEEAATGVSNAGLTVNANLTTTGGIHEFSVILSNEAGNSTETKATAFIGPDEPGLLDGIVVNPENSGIALTWNPVKGAHNGYIDQSKVTYTVTRMPENLVVASNITSCSFFDSYIEPEELVSIYYTIQASYNGKDVQANSSKITVGAIKPPYSNDFKQPDAYLGYSIIDNNNDRFSWNTAHGYAVYYYNSSNAADDYLVLPPMKLQKGMSYTFSFDAKCEDSSDAERVAVYAGTTPEAVSLTTEVIVPTTIDHTTYKTLEGVFVAPADGNYYFAIKACSDAYKYYLYVTNISVSEASSAQVPAAVSSLALIPADFGELSATVSFIAPNVTIEGSTLNELSNVEIYLENELYTTVDAKPGESVNETINVNAPGTYKVKVISRNSTGEGISSEVEAYIGLAIPKAPEYVSVIQGDAVDEMIVSWAPVQLDINGCRMNPDQVTYTLTRIEGSKSIEIATGLRVNTYTDKAITKEGEQKFVQYSVKAVNSTGFSQSTYSGQEIAGTSYTLPFVESVASGLLNHPLGLSWLTEERGNWTMNTDSSLRDTDSQDADDGYLCFAGDRNASGAISTGRISLKNATRPTLIFYFKTYGGIDNLNMLEVAVSSGGSYTALETFSMAGDDQWKKAVVSLEKYIGRNIQIRFNAQATSHRYIMIDNILVRDVKDFDLTVSMLEAPVKTVSGKDAIFTTAIRNSGALEADNYSVILSCNDEEVARVAGTPLAPDSTATFTLAHSVSSWIEGSLEYVASVEYEADQAPADNDSEPVDVAFELPTVPAPENLVIEGATNMNVRLSWDTPTLTSKTAPIVDSAEEYTAFSNGMANSALGDKDNVGEWIMVDLDGHGTLGAKNAQNYQLSYPNARAAMSFQIFDAEALELTDATYQPRTGSKMWICFSSLSGANDDWMISPELSGLEQTINFFARSASSLYGLESLEVLTSATGTEITDFSLVKSIAEVPNVWSEVSVTIPDGVKYFAIRCTSDDKYALCIDDITMITAESAGTNLKLLGYNVYREKIKINENVVETPKFSDDNPLDMASMPKYFVTALYNNGESVPSNEVQISGQSFIDATIGLKANITVNDSVIVITGIEDDAVTSVMTIDGRVLYTGKGNARFKVASGVYIVTAGTLTAKLAVR